MKKLFIIFALSIFLCGCATVGDKIDWNNARQVRDGMDQQEVTKLLGKPYRVIANGDGTQKWVWVYANGWSGASQSAALSFTKEGKVMKAFDLPDSFK